MSVLAVFGSIGMQEGLIILVVGLLIFGSRLPEVGRSLGRGLMEFKKGLRGIQDEVRDLDWEADRQIDAEVARRRQTADPHDLADDPRTPPEDRSPFAHEFVDGDPAAREFEQAGSAPPWEEPTTAEEAAPEMPPAESKPEPETTGDEDGVLRPRDPVEGSSAWSPSKPTQDDA